MANSEYEIQKAFIKWCEVATCRYPNLNKVIHIANEGKRSYQTAAMLKAMGMKSGVPDLFIPVPRKCWHGLFIEMKTEKGKASENQVKWIETLSSLGYKAVICHGFDEAVEAVKRYYG